MLIYMANRMCSHWLVGVNALWKAVIKLPAVSKWLNSQPLGKSSPWFDVLEPDAEMEGLFFLNQSWLFYGTWLASVWILLHRRGVKGKARPSCDQEGPTCSVDGSHFLADAGLPGGAGSLVCFLSLLTSHQGLTAVVRFSSRSLCIYIICSRPGRIRSV